MRIAVDGRYINDRCPGVGRYTYNLVAAVAAALGRDHPGGDNRDELMVILNSRLPNRRFDLQALAASPAVRLVDCSIPRYWPAEAIRLPLLARELRPSLFHSPFFLRPYPLPCPGVATLFDLTPLDFPRGFAFPDRWLFRLGAHLACRHSAAVITCTATAAAAVGRRFPASNGKLRVVPGAADPAFRPLEPAERSRRLSGAGLPRLPAGASYVLHVGSPLAHKDSAGALRAWAHLRDGGFLARHNLYFAMVGAGSGPAGPLGAVVSRLGLERSVAFLGDVSDEVLAALYGGARLLIFPSRSEGFGLPVVEAMACGTPVVGARIPSVEDVTRGAARLVPPGDPVALAEAMRETLEDEPARGEMSRRGLARARDFDWDRSAASLLRVYRDVLGLS